MLAQQVRLSGSMPQPYVWEPFRDGVDMDVDVVGAKSLQDFIARLALAVINHTTASYHVTCCPLGKSTKNLRRNVYALRETYTHSLSRGNFLWFFRRQPIEMNVTSTVLEVIEDSAERQVLCIVFDEHLLPFVEGKVRYHNQMYHDNSSIYKKVVVVKGGDTLPHEGPRTVLINK